MLTSIISVIDVSISWSSPLDDQRIMTAATDFVDGAIAAAKNSGLDYKFIYQNYAAKGQEVFDGYGEVNKQRLIDISHRYDPEQVFQKLQPGYFKLGG